LVNKFGKFGTRLIEYANGIDTTPLEQNIKRKSISSESTLAMDTNKVETIKKNLLLHSGACGTDLRKKGMKTNNISIKFKFSDFSQMTKQTKIEIPTCSTQAIYKVTLSLLEKIKLTKKIRLIGVNVACIKKKSRAIQLDLMDEIHEQTEKWESVDRAIDSISDKFGSNIIKNATLNINKP